MQRTRQQQNLDAFLDAEPSQYREEDSIPERLIRGVFPNNFVGSGKRFWVRSEYQALQDAQMAAFQAKYERKDVAPPVLIRVQPKPQPQGDPHASRR